MLEEHGWDSMGLWMKECRFSKPGNANVHWREQTTGLYEYLEATHEYHREWGRRLWGKGGKRNLVSMTIFVLFVFSVTMRAMFISTLDQDSCRFEVWVCGV